MAHIGSISSGTTRMEDLIPAFLWELEQQQPLKRGHRKRAKEITARLAADSDEEEYFDSERAGWDLEALCDALNEYAPDYFFFGAHPGDCADYGFWLVEGFQDDFEGLKVADVAEVPKGYVGEVLHVNDHGNMTLYFRGRDGRMTEKWGIV